MDGWTHPKGGSRMELLENALDESVKYLEYELDLARDNIETRKDLVKFLKSAQVNPVQLKYTIESRQLIFRMGWILRYNTMKPNRRKWSLERTTVMIQSGPGG